MHIEDRVAVRLQEELIAWMTTVTRAGQPHTSPVWFLWDGQDFLVYSLADTARLRNISQNPRVSLHLDGDGLGGDIVVVEGSAEVDPDALSAAEMSEYVAKYQERFDTYGWTPEGFAADYQVAIRIRPSKIRAH